MEIERKLLLKDRIELDAIRSQLRGTVVLHQRNIFFDDAAAQLQAVGLALRLREVDDCTWLTVKGPADEADGFLRRGEWERELTRTEAGRLLADDPGAGDGIADWMRAQGVTWPNLGPLRPVGEFQNTRWLGHPAGGGDLPLEVALDRSVYPDGSVGFELELELHGEEPRAALAVLESLLRRAQVVATPSRVSKRARLARALEQPPQH